MEEVILWIWVPLNWLVYLMLCLLVTVSLVQLEQPVFGVYKG